MPPRSPLPRRGGLTASWLRTPDNDPGRLAPWATMREFLLDRLPPDADVAGMLASGRFVDAAGAPWSGAEAYRPNAFVWFHRDRAPEPVVPFPLEILHADDRIVVVDKPHFLATTPRGAHVTESIVAKLRVRLGLDDLAPAHRLDRLTAGVLLLTTQRRWRGAYAGVFADRSAHKTYEALAPASAQGFPQTWTGRIVKQVGVPQARLVPGEVNAVTHVDLVEVRGDVGRYVLNPATGKTHQLRLQMSAAGLPIVNDPLYPQVREVARDDFTAPLQLIARSLAFIDPIDGRAREFTSGVRLDWPVALPGPPGQPTREQVAGFLREGPEETRPLLAD